MTITQFSGEDRRQAIINHFSLDIEEEDEFFEFVEEMGYDIDETDEMMISIYNMFVSR